MEKIISTEERIRRAEEVYRRRKENGNVRVYGSRINNKKKNLSLFRKMSIQIFVCFLIYLAFYTIKNSEYFFSEDATLKVKQFLETDMNFSQIGKDISKKAGDYLNSLGIVWKDNNEENKIEEEKVEETKENTVEQEIIEQNTISENEAGIGGGDEESPEENNQQMKELSPEEADIKYVKENISIINPLPGSIVTSRYGIRTPTDIVSANHGGIDLGANTGTNIIAAMDGEVTQVSEEGDFGKHIRITSGEVTTLYAHCSELLVSQGQSIKQGDVIAKVGMTGRATGPHLHFEIRRQDRKINPENILSF